jgi:hypothetical protein
VTISRRILLRMSNVSDKSRKENQNLRFMFNHFFLPENHVDCANVQKYGIARQTTRDNIMLHTECGIARQITRDNIMLHTEYGIARQNTRDNKMLHTEYGIARQITRDNIMLHTEYGIARQTT